MNWPDGQPSQVFSITFPEASRSTNRWFAAQFVTPLVQFDESERDVTGQALHWSAWKVP
jgi:hypothetical protein